ncbi:MAG: nitroreductase/quinone reductase family protein [Ilumatobacteraceae bacterium]
MSKMALKNWMPAAILRSPLHRLLSGKRLVLTFVGRRSGTRYATPVNYLQRGNELLITTDSPWWHNFTSGAPVDIRLRGHSVSGSARTILDPEVVVEALTALVRDHPPYGRWAHVGVDSDGSPNADDVRAEVARGRVLIRVQLPPEANVVR